tara:strand:- start:977 stop:1348 length:372 start_codon:yes stop_codon:yes gene_type:complete
MDNPFTDDYEKMKDFFQLSKEDWLKHYSYMTEAEYVATENKVAQWGLRLEDIPTKTITSKTLNPEIVEDAITWYESKGITCRNEGDDFVDVLVRDKAGVAMAWVQVSRKELEYRADMLEEEHR